ncbi:hypothetical protein SEVIR_9G430900v4 [Setaria viridis]|uniref:IBH1-like N-terminal domain-containing protein n=2 Tax=Setaria TaxID=4554 RepID=A0A368STQ8_SETIT|nr:transcription factor bHLH147-like [Setaria italica]XP_034571310.1 transcription factor bHLH147 [Setaria viridis]RCV45110.1 hypothetical protein SETIT_9G426800v2 [Setaria italica]TKV96476.1 hypothetical protein SEVIR_9G430900v2 [Setaria viridis]
MASTSSSTPAAEEEERGRKRKRAPGAEPAAATQPSKWRKRREHELYSSKLIEAIRLVRAGPSGAGAAGPPRGRAVREAADRALAVAARGRTHWSRAILASRRRRLQAARRARLRAPASPSSRHGAATSASTSAPGQGSSTPPLARKAKVLGRLVPGCRKLPFSTLLEETTDYIAALQMQIRVMTAVAEALSAISATSSSSNSGAGSSSSPA